MNQSVYQARFWRSKVFQKWLSKRIPASNSVTLNQKKIFILPTREGLYFIGVILLMTLAGINYQNSLIFIVAFLLLSVFFIGIFHTYRNLSGLTLMAGSCRSAFAGEDAEFRILVRKNSERSYEALHLGWDTSLLTEHDLTDAEEINVSLFVPTRKRGPLNPGRLLIQTFFPLGLFKAWSWISLDVSTLVYPRPVSAGDVPLSLRSSQEGELVEIEGTDDFYGLRTYNEGDSFRHVDWKSYAKTDELMIKQFASTVDKSVWLDWDHFTGMDTESRLSRLCHWVLRYSASNDEYGLRLPGVEIPPGRGEPHREKLLKELALFGFDQAKKTN